MKTKIIVLFLFLLIYVRGFAQLDSLGLDTSNMVTFTDIMTTETMSATTSSAFLPVVSPSPKAQSFHLYGDIPVSLSTGTPDISIPLYTIKAKGIEIPIVLRYHIHSLKPTNENMTNIAWGWTLEYGGIISRTIYDNPDEVMVSEKDIRNSYLLDESVEQNYNYLRASQTFLNKSLGNDTEYDIFTYSFLGKNGKFMIDKENNAWNTYLIENDPGIITLNCISGTTMSNEIIDEIVFTDEFGVNYTFGEGKVEKRNFQYRDECPTSWMISKIEDQYNEKLCEFFYENTQYSYYKLDNDYIGIYNDAPKRMSAQMGAANPFPDIEISLFNEQGLQINYDLQTIKKIEFVNGTIEFSLDTYNQKINSFTVKDNWGNIIKKVEFIRSNFEGISYSKLTDLIVKDNENNEVYNYQFKYFGEATYSGYTSIDYYGFFNGGRTTDDLNPFRTYDYIRENGLTETASIGDGNRLASTKAYQYALTKIIYPTGGSTEFTYGLNQFNEISDGISSTPCNLTSGGGFRISKIESKDSDGTIVKKRNYVYEPGFINFDVNNFQNFTSTTFKIDSILGWAGYEYWRSRNREFSNTVKSDLGLNPVYYKKVSEYIGEINSNNIGHVVSSFKYPNLDQFISFSNTWPSSHPLLAILFDDYNSYLFKDINIIFQRRGFGNNQLEKKEYFNESGTGYYNNTGLVKKEVYNYGIDNEQSFENLRITKLTDYGQSSGEFGPVGEYQNRMSALSALEGEDKMALPFFFHYNYKVVTGDYNLYSKIVTNYSENGHPIEESIEYSYNENGIVNEIISSSSLNDIVTKRYFVTDYGPSQNFGALRSRNIIGKPLDVRTYNGTQLISGKQTKYNDYGLPLNVYIAEPTGTDISFSPSNPYTFTHKASYSYNGDNAVKQITAEDNYNTVFLWDATGTYMMAKVENADYNDIDQFDGQACTTDSEGLHDDIMGEVPNALVTTYTYKPLVGIKQQTDTSGVTIYYDYDSLGRLSTIKNDEDKLLKKYDYHYAN